MQALFAVVAVALSGQVGSSRYDAPEVAAEAPTPAAAAPEVAPQPEAERAKFSHFTEAELSAAGESNPLRGAAPAQPTPSAIVPDFNQAAAAGESLPAGSALDSPVTPGVAPPVTAKVHPRDLVRELLRGPQAGSQLTGTPLTLMQAIAGAADRSEQTHLAEAYWDLSAAVADYHLALAETAELRSLANSLPAPGQAWQQIGQQQQLRTTTAVRNAQAAQTRLQGLMGGSVAAPLPLPADAPHAGRYESRYDQIFAGRTNSVARQLNDLLPVEFDNIARLCDAVVEADQRLAATNLHAADPTGDALLQAHELLSLRRREFVDAVRHYNHHIAEYTELATPGQVETRRLVAMLIKTSATVDSQVAAASAQEPELADETPVPYLNQVPPTYPGGDSTADADAANATRFRARRPILDSLRTREHSILKRTMSRIRN